MNKPGDGLKLTLWALNNQMKVLNEMVSHIKVSDFKPLTDSQIEQLMDLDVYVNFEEFKKLVRKVEQAHGIES